LVHSLADKEDFAGVWVLPLINLRESGGGAKIVCDYPTIGVPDV
jgi:hypothetical protein